MDNHSSPVSDSARFAEQAAQLPSLFPLSVSSPFSVYPERGSYGSRPLFSLELRVLLCDQPHSGPAARGAPRSLEWSGAGLLLIDFFVQIRAPYFRPGAGLDSSEHLTPAYFPTYFQTFSYDTGAALPLRVFCPVPTRYTPGPPDPMLTLPDRLNQRPCRISLS